MALTWPELTEGQWNKIATNVTSGIIDRLRSEFTYWATSVATGENAPDDEIKDKSPVIFQDSSQEIINSNESIDVYIWIENSDNSINSISENCIMVAI